MLAYFSPTGYEVYGLRQQLGMGIRAYVPPPEAYTPQLRYLGKWVLVCMREVYFISITLRKAICLQQQLHFGLLFNPNSHGWGPIRPALSVTIKLLLQ